MKLKYTQKKFLLLIFNKQFKIEWNRSLTLSIRQIALIPSQFSVTKQIDKGPNKLKLLSYP